MLPIFKRVLYATDLSENSRLAFGYAMSIAKQYQAVLMVLHVIEPVNPNTYTHISGAMGEADWLRLQADYENGMLDRMGAKLRQFCGKMQTQIDEVEIKSENMLIRKGMSVDEIIAAAAERDADLIVMGTHGYSMVKDALMGGTARRVVRRSEKPVLVIRNPDED